MNPGPRAAHVQRLSGRHRIYVVGPPTMVFGAVLCAALPRGGADIRQHPGLAAWDVPERHARAVWGAMMIAWGPRRTCRACAERQPCPYWDEEVERAFSVEPEPVAPRRRPKAASPPPPPVDWRRDWSHPAGGRRAGTSAYMAPERTSAARVLGVRSGASRAEVIAAFRRAALSAHPDRGGSEAAMRRVLAARDALLGV